jgi:hypothetical protein
MYICYSVLLGSVACGVAPIDAAFISKFDKGFGHEFSAFVVLQLLDFCLKLVLSKCLVGFESIKGVAFLFEPQCGTVG